MQEKENYVLIKENHLKSIIAKVEELEREVISLKGRRCPAFTVLTNEDVKSVLHINNKLIKKYRDSGLLNCSFAGNKYWYKWEDVEKFLKATKYGTKK